MSGGSREQAGRPAAPPQVGESWPQMIDELERDRDLALVTSRGRSLLEGIFDDGGFREVGRLVGLGGQEGQQGLAPGGVVAGWGRRGPSSLFAAADEGVGPASARNAGGAALATTVHVEAFKSRSPLLRISGAARMRSENWPAAAFGRLGLQLDVEFERRSLSAIPKLAAVFGEVDRVALLEVAFSHYAVAAADAVAVLPDGRRVSAARAAELGWVDAVAAGDAEVQARLGALLDLLAAAGPRPAASSPQRPEAEPSAGAGPEQLLTGVLDRAPAVRFSEGAAGTLASGIGAVAGTTLGFAAGAPSTAADRVRLDKARLLCGALALPLLLLCPEAEDPFEPLRLALAGDWPRPAVAVVLGGAAIAPEPLGLPVYSLPWSPGSPGGTRASLEALLPLVLEPARRRNPAAEDASRVRPDVSGAPTR